MYAPTFWLCICRASNHLMQLCAQIRLHLRIPGIEHSEFFVSGASTPDYWAKRIYLEEGPQQLWVLFQGGLFCYRCGGGGGGGGRRVAAFR